VSQVKRQDAPGSLELVREFVNTLDLEQGTDLLQTAAGLRAWLAERGLITGAAAVDRASWQEAVRVREALRGLARMNSGGAAEAAALDALEQLAREAGVGLRFTSEGSMGIAARAADSVRAALGGLLAAVGTAGMNGTWQRLKICPAQDCQWAFYDHSKNRSGRWCQMAECGNRAKGRSFRTRHSDIG
jgi:predicted RNA-binding Zn ribbon-like protein